MKILLLSVFIFISNSAMACACCGVDGTWMEYEVNYLEYPADILPKIKLKGGELNDYLEGEYYVPIRKVILTDKRYTLETELGNLYFDFDDLVEIKTVDITFAKVKEYKYTNDAVIYREFILSGLLSASEEFISKDVSTHLKEPVRSKLVLQGLGNSCAFEEEFEKWILKIENTQIGGHGDI